MLWRPALVDYLSPSVAEQGPILPWYSSTYMNSATLQQGQSLGERWTLKGTLRDAGGNTFQIVRARAALSRGQLVALDAPLTGTATAAGSTVAVINTAITGTFTANQLVDRIVYFLTGPATRYIKASSASTNTPSITVALTDYTIASKPNDPDVLAAVPTDGTALSVIEPYAVRVCTASLNPVGVALGTVTSGNYTIVQIGGLAEVLTVGTGTATVYGVPAVPGAAGVITGSAAAAANIYVGGGNIIPLHAHSGASQLVATLVNFTGA